MVRTISIPGWSMSARNIVAAPSSPLAMMMAKPAPSAPVMNHLVPLITQWLPSCTAVVFNAEGSDPAPGAGSVMQKHERMSPRANGRSQRSFCSFVATCSSKWMLPSSGAKMCSATGPSSE